MKKKEKRSILYKLFKAIIITLSIPIFLVWLTIIALYIPPVQRFVVDKICSIASEESGFDIIIGSFHLAFPLTASIADFQVSRNDTIFAHGEHADVNISLSPLLKGEIEVNYVSLEKIKIDTHELIEGIKADGEIGNFRVVARNINLENEVANLRQIHLHSTYMNIELSDTAAQEEEEESLPLNWAVSLRRGNIENCRFNISLPNDTMKTSVGIGKIRLGRGKFDLGNEMYSIGRFSINGSYVIYDRGTLSMEEAPLDHIDINNINLGCRDIFYSPDSANIKVDKMTFAQVGGIRITDTEAHLTADANMLDIKKLAIKSKNGSYIDINTRLPWSAISLKGRDKLVANLSMAFYKSDLYGVLTREQIETISLLQDKMLVADMKVHGNISRIELDTAYIDIPAIATLRAGGHAINLNNFGKLEAELNFNGSTGDLHYILGTPFPEDSTATGVVDIKGKINYDRGEATAYLGIRNDGGRVFTRAKYDINNQAYSASMRTKRLNIANILPDIPLKNLTMSLKANGEGLDLFDGLTKYNATLKIDTLNYDKYLFDNISLTANQENHISDVEFNSNAQNLKLLVKAKTRLDTALISTKMSVDLDKADFMMMKLTDVELGTAMHLKIDASTDLQEQHALKLAGRGFKIITEKRTFTPADINIDFSTTPDSSYIVANNGDLKITGNISSGYTGLFEALEKTGRMYMEGRHSDSTLYYLHDYEKELPYISFNFSCGKNNMLHNFLAFNQMQIDNINMKLKLDTIGGLNMSSGIYGFKTGELNLDTIRAFTRQEGNKIRYFAGLRSTAVNPAQEKQTFNAALFGNIFNDSLTTNFVFRDKKEGVGIRFGLKTLLMPEGLNIKFQPDATLLGKKFMFSKDNHINIGKGFSIEADVLLSDSSNAGMHIYTNPDPTASYNANLDLFNVNLKKVTSLLPFAPDISGMLNLNLFFRQSNEKILISSDATIDSLGYEGTDIGNEALGLLYFPKNSSTHYIDVNINHDGEDVAQLSGDYVDDPEDPGLHGNIILTRLPLDITRAFTKDAGMDLSGYINSSLSATGKFSKLLTNGYVQFDSVYIDAPLFGTKLHLANERANIENNDIIFKDFNIYAKGDNPFKVNGTIGLSKLADPSFSLRMNANDYELINTKRKRGNMLYGRMFVDFRSFIGGTLNNMKIYGNATLLGKSDITYVMLDAPIETDKELDGLVEFVNFNDSTKTEKVEEDFNFGNSNFNFNLKIEDGARINADFDENRNSYIKLQGGGNLNVTYTSETGMNVIGTYTMSEGEMKYELPIIPLKTFSIADGSKVSWTGDIFDPDINITALERITTSVTMDDNSMQPVAFDVGVKLSNTLSNMGLSFTISAPENAAIQDHLNTLDAETLNKYAVTMLITGTYIGNSKGMTVSNALSTFLDSKINDLAGSAMKSVSVNVAINDAQNAETGSTYKNYSFSFRKRFWNDRITIVIGGEVNSGDHPTGNDSFINNVSLEWKISDSSNRFVRLFYDKNYESLLEGEIIETGVGYIYKRKFDSLSELFIFRKKEETQPMPREKANAEKKKEE